MIRILTRAGALLGANLRDTIQRTLSSGWASGWTCGKTHALNFVRRIHNRLCRHPQVECPCCGWQGYGFFYLDCGKFIVPNAECPTCRAHERHRMLHVLHTRRAPAFMKQDPPQAGFVLHFAPETHVRRFIDQKPHLTTLATDYALYMIERVPRPGVQADMQHLPLANESVEGIYCMHVLEHVPDDRAGIRELHRVLKAGGEAIIMAPFMMHQTETEEYGRPVSDFFDHVRGYSPLDFKYRLEPFAYEEIMPADLLSPEEIARYQIPDSQAIYVCRKRR